MGMNQHLTVNKDYYCTRCACIYIIDTSHIMCIIKEQEQLVVQQFHPSSEEKQPHCTIASCFTVLTGLFMCWALLVLCLF